MTLHVSSLASSRAWAPLGLMLVLSCGAWFFRDVPRPRAPVEEAGAGGWIQPGPGAGDGAQGGLGTSAGDRRPPPTAAPTAEQVLAEVSRRGQLADEARAAATARDAPTASPESLQARLKQDSAAVHRQTAGQRLRLQGALASIEAGEPGVVVLHLALPGEARTVRVVASPALASVAGTWAPPRSVSLDCLSQGVMMGEWLLVDCRE